MKIIISLASDRRVQTLKALNKIVQAKFPNVEVVKGKGYFYLVFPDSESWYSTNIDVNSVSHLTVDAWMESIQYILAHKERH